jgi:PGF-CTERM protein
MEGCLKSLLFLIVFIGFLTPAMGHQPFFEDKEFTFDSPGHIGDPTISNAMYATLETPTNVDYYDFNGSIGESIFLSITIPQIAGQENFAPTMALIGPGLHDVDLPKNVKKPQYSGALLLPPANVTTFFEPFSRTSYWTRQEQNVTLPANGRYFVAVWDDKGQTGRYVFVIGYKEVLGGIFAFPLKIRNYWKPLKPFAQAQTSAQPANETASSPNNAQPGFEAVFALIALVAVAYVTLGKDR